MGIIVSFLLGLVFRIQFAEGIQVRPCWGEVFGGLRNCGPNPPAHQELCWAEMAPWERGSPICEQCSEGVPSARQ